MILRDKYSMVVCTDDFDYKWCSKKGVWCPKDEFHWMCGECYRR